MSLSAALAPRHLRPAWLPPAGVIDAVAAGRWWDAIAIDGTLGRTTARLLQDAGCRGPVLCDPLGPEPRIYFLVPVRTADRWDEPETTALGASCFIGMTGTLDADDVGLHWITPPRCTRTQPLVATAALRRALAEARSTT